MNAKSKLTRQGNSTGLTLSREFLDRLGWDRGQEVAISVVGDHLEIRAADPTYEKAMEAAQHCFGRYATTLKKLAE